MPRSRDYIPTNDAAFDRFFKNIVDYGEAKTQGTDPAWPHISHKT
jgi:hypothetical protein